MPNVGPIELAIVLIIALVVFGPKRLPELGRSLGRGIREFRGSLSGGDHELEQRDAIEAPSPAEKSTEGENVASTEGENVASTEGENVAPERH